MLEICFKIQTEECKSKHSGICDIFILFIFYSLSYFHSQKVKAFPFLFEKKNGLAYMNTRSFSSSLIFISMCVFSFILSLPLSLFFLPSLFPFLPLFFRNLEMRSDLIFYFLHFYFWWLLKTCDPENLNCSKWDSSFSKDARKSIILIYGLHQSDSSLGLCRDFRRELSI